jgi:cytosine/uracil/thiamine/allantoin permease
VNIKEWPESWPAPPLLIGLYDYAWFVGFALAFVLYLVLKKLFT